jgi:hypothetical protein
VYVSNAVTPMVEDPPDEPVALVLRTDDDTDTDTLVAAVEDIGGEHERDLGFGDVLVTVPGDAVGDVLDIAGLSAVETGALAEMTDADGAGEDVEMDDGGDID